MDNEMSSFGIEKIIKLFFEKWYIFVALLSACLVACTVYCFGFLREHYVAATTIYVTEEAKEDKNENTELIVNEERAKDYKIIATSNRVLDKVKYKYPDIHIKPSNVSVKEYPDTRIFEISVKDEDPYNAATIVNEITRVMINEVQDIISKNNIRVIDFADIPTVPVKGRIYVYYILALVAAVFVTLVIILLYEIFDNKVKGPEDYSERFDIPILGMIPRYDIYEDFEKIKEKGNK